MKDKNNFWADREIDAQESTWDRDFSFNSTRAVEDDESWWYDEK